MSQIQVLSLVNRVAAAAHWPFMLSHVFTQALNMPGQDNFYHFGGRWKAFCQLPMVGVVKLNCVSGYKCRVTARVLAN